MHLLRDVWGREVDDHLPGSDLRSEQTLNNLVSSSRITTRLGAAHPGKVAHLCEYSGNTLADMLLVDEDINEDLHLLYLK
jgi:hypothetical protein